MLKTVAAFVKQGLLAAWKFFGKPAIDDPKTPKDESDVFDPAVEAAIDALIEAALKEAKKRGMEVTPMDLAKKVIKDQPQIALKDALAKVNRALGRN
jgi:hypothetical protein